MRALLDVSWSAQYKYRWLILETPARNAVLYWAVLSKEGNSDDRKAKRKDGNSEGGTGPRTIKAERNLAGGWGSLDRTRWMRVRTRATRSRANRESVVVDAAP